MQKEQPVNPYIDPGLGSTVECKGKKNKPTKKIKRKFQEWKDFGNAQEG